MNWKELRKKFGEHLKRLMVQKGLTTRQMMKLSKLSKQTIDRLQNGPTDPRLGTLLQYAAALGITVKELFEPLIVGSSLTEDDELIEIARRLLRDPQRGEVIRSFIRSMNR